MQPGISVPRREPSSGFALVLVLGFLVLLTVLVVAFFTSVTTDYASSKQYSNGAATRQLADSVVQVAMGQIKLATVGTDPTTGRTAAWASQPGMIRTYDDTGAELTNYKLYSSSAMTTSGPLSLIQVSDYDAAWRTKTAAWTDLNAPVIDAAGTVNFPIIDSNKMASLTLPGGTSPSLTYDGIDNTTGLPKTAANPGDGVPDIQGFAVNLPATFSYDSLKPLSPKNTPVPMPVTWLYQLADGSLIAPDAASTTTATFVNASTQPSVGNPIVGRVAFWTDDETSKLNINTACGDEWNPTQVTPGPSPVPAGTTAYTPPGSYWDVPRAFTSYDYNNLALNQPAQHEYQRYPGHPATAYLSAVFPYATRDQLFALVPRVSGGGSQGGTAIPANTLTPDADRLYASLDELLFKPTINGTIRNPNDAFPTPTPAASPPPNPSRANLERAKFFLTANSRAPEVNLFNKPRIAVWPVDQDVVVQQSANSQTPSPRGTAFDNLIAFCTHLGPLGSGNDYIFQRSEKGYLSQTKDYDLATTGGGQRNHLLYSYLQSLATAPIPGFGGNLAAKFGADSNQVLTEIFDYIRCVNPSDDNIAFHSTPPNSSPVNGANCYTPAEQYVASILTGGYSGSPILDPLPYHAFIAPAKIGATQGFGRTVTLSEIGLAFICNADGTSDNTNPLWTGAATRGDGGLTATVNYPSQPDTGKTYYSNFPPLKTLPTTPAQIAAHPFFKSAPGYKTGLNAPGFVSANWNVNLPLYDWASDVTGTLWTGLAPGQRRVQGIFLLDPYTVSPGYSTMHMDIGLQVSGLSTITIPTLASIGFPEGKTVIMSTSTYRTPTFGVNLPFFYTSFLAPVRQLVDAPAAQLSQSDGDSVTPTVVGLRHTPYRTYEFVSSPFTVNVNAANTMQLTGGQGVSINIWHLSPTDEGTGVQSLNTPSNSSALIQTLNVDLSTLLSSPWLIPKLYVPVGLPPGSPNPPNPTYDSGLANVRNAAAEWDFSWAGVFGNATPRGRFFDDVDISGHYIEPAFIQTDVVKTMVPGYPTDATGVGGDYRLLAARNTVSAVFVPHRLTIAGNTPPVPSLIHSFPMAYFNGQQIISQEGMDAGQATSSSGYGAKSGSTPTAAGPAEAPFGALITSIPPNAALNNNVSNLIAVKTGDYDNGLASDMDGPYINKPDTGYNYNAGANTYPYFGGFAENSTPGYFSPNRQIPSPGMFGSLPVGVVRGLPWQTLLFRPQPLHPDGVPVPETGVVRVTPAPYAGVAADHLIMDWFWMPVVEPYALSEPFSTAGKINMNYQIAPFTYITRATAVDALLKSQRLLAIPLSIPNHPAPPQDWKEPLTYSGFTGPNSYSPAVADFRSDLNLSNVDGTLRQFEATFNGGDIFRSPTQICDIYLTPKGQSWKSNSDAESFWAANLLTGDNSRERPYANLYGCLTTKSNTYTVHFRVQALQKVPSTPVAQWVDGRDAVVGDTRGSTVIERYVDCSDASLPDFTTNTTATLDKYYKFRVVSTKKFAP